MKLNYDFKVGFTSMNFSLKPICVICHNLIIGTFIVVCTYLCVFVYEKIEYYATKLGFINDLKVFLHIQFSKI